MKVDAKVTSKGQITIPLAIRKKLGLCVGDRVTFVKDGQRVELVHQARAESPFAKYQGIGNPGLGSGIDAINRYVRELRGHDDFD